MKMRTRIASGTVTCTLEAAQNLHIRSDADTDLSTESIGYAVCRFVRRNTVLRHVLTWESYQLRLGKGGKQRFRQFVAPAPLLELPGAWASVRLAVSPAGVTVVGVSLSNSYPRHKGNNESPWVQSR